MYTLHLQSGTFPLSILISCEWLQRVCQLSLNSCRALILNAYPLPPHFLSYQWSCVICKVSNPNTGNIEYCVLDEDYILVLVKGTTCSDYYIYTTLPPPPSMPLLYCLLCQSFQGRSFIDVFTSVAILVHGNTVVPLVRSSQKVQTVWTA